MTLVSAPTGRFSGTATVPSDKSLAHRALILASMSPGQSRVTITGAGADVDSTRRALTVLGTEITEHRILSRGISGWRQPDRPIDCGNSGTTMRLLAGALAGSGLAVTLVGDESLSSRPMGRLCDALAPLGGSITATADGTPPVTVEGRSLHGARVELPLPSAQVRTAVALAALSAEGDTTIDSPPGFRDHTERWLEALGRGSRDSETRFTVHPGAVPPLELTVPGDPSSAAFLWTAAALQPGCSVTTPGVSANPGRTGLLTVLEQMGAGVDVRPAGSILGDPIADVTVTGDALQGAVVEGALAVSTLDELPLVALLAACAEGDTTVAGASELRVKETDRIAASVAMVRALGGDASETDDGFTVRGGTLGGGVVDAKGDHRIAMAAAVAAAPALGAVEVRGLEAAAVSWPGFLESLESLWSSR